MSGLTSHVLDTGLGVPARNVRVVLERQDQGAKGWQVLAEQVTNADGRTNNFATAGVTLERGTYQLRFDVASYFLATKRETLYGIVPIVFNVEDPQAHYHIPLLISPFGYSTYRGS